LNYIIPYHTLYSGESVSYSNSLSFPGKVYPVIGLSLKSKVHLLEGKPSTHSTYIRTHNSYGRIINQYVHHTLIILPSKKLKYLSNKCNCHIGLIYKQSSLNFYKAGQKRALNYLSMVRGVAKNTFSHPMGGGRGKSKSNKIPRTPYGKIIKK